MYSAENQKRIPIFTQRRRPLADVTLACQKSKCDPENPVKAEQYKSGTEIERKGASQMNNRSNLRGSFGSLLRRGVSLALASAMSLSLLPATAWAAPNANTSAPAIGATQVADKSEFPKIELQLNIVRTEYGTLNGTAELSLRVGPSNEPDAEGNTVTSVSFHTLATNLQFNTDLLTPIDWEWVADLSDITAEPKNNKINLEQDSENKAFNEYYQVAIPAKKDDTLPSTGAIAQCGIVDSTTANANGMSTSVANGKQALLFFKAEAYDQPITLTEMTTLAVIRFKVNDTLMKHLSITADGNYTYTLHSDLLTSGDDTVKTMATLNGVVDAVKKANELTLTDFVTVAGFAENKDISLSDPERGLALYYSSGTNEYYFVPGDMLGNTEADKTGTTTVPIGGTNYTLNVPKTENTDDMILAVDSTKADGDADKYSYTSNLIPADNISFTVVSEMSYADQGVDLDKYSVLVFVDWDNTLLGTLVVPKYENVTSLVNEYVKENFIHPQFKDNTNYSSTARVDTYRGKYIATTPSAESATDDTVVTDGEKYPLTNKLDYAFLRRPMERATTTDDSGNIVLTAENTWVQKTATDGTAVYDTKYPYAYGWAKCTAENYTEVWTTLGTTGELNSWDAGDGTTTVASVTSTDSAFEIADLESGLGKDDSTVFLKAIYEPGDSLLSVGYTYRLYTTPAYNKLNYSPASAGGAYSISLQLERANTDSGKVQGATRIREPYIRMQASTDYRWKEEEELGIKNNLTNPTLNDASQEFKETTYILVNVENTDVMNVELTASAKHYMLDYYLIDGYGETGNFVSGDGRTLSNYVSETFEDFTVIASGTNSNVYDYGKGDANYIIRNFNYYVDGESDQWDPEKYFANVMTFADKAGSHGFVLYGTLNSMMQKATQYNDGVVDSTTFNYYTGKDILVDANLRLDSTGTEPTDRNVTQFRNAMLRAAELCAQYKGQSNEDDYWDSRLDCARLTYHQLQWFIIDYTVEGSSATLLDPVTADNAAHKLSWCHLHSTCAAGQQKKPTTWESLINLAKGDTDDQMAIATMTVDEFENLTHLRVDSDGSKFTNPTQFKNAVVNAVASLILSGAEATWENVQYAILNPAYDGSTGGPGIVYPESGAAIEEKRSYWWYDGATGAEIDGWSETDPATGTSLMTALKDATVAVTYPDGVTTHTTDGKLNNLEKNFTKGFDSTVWIDATHNLATKYDTNTDTPSLEGDFVTLKNKLTDAYTALSAAGKLGGDEQTVWKRVQYYFLNGTVPATDADLGDYWWYDGNFKIKDVETMLRAAKENGTTWANFTVTDLYAEKTLAFAMNLKGEKYTDTDTFKADIAAYLARDDYYTDNWEHLQYYLINKTTQNTPAYLDKEAAYYWWKDEGACEPVDFTLDAISSEVRANQLAVKLADAVFRAEYNGNTAALTAFVAETVSSGRLLGSYDPNVKKFEGQTVATVEAVLAAAKSLMADWTGPIDQNPVPTFTWEELQEKLLGALPAEEDGGAWWKANDTLSVEMSDADKLAAFNTLCDKIEVVARFVANINPPSDTDQATALADLQAYFTVELAQQLGFKSGTSVSAPVGDAEVATLNEKWTSFNYKNTRTGAKCFNSSDNFTITWHQIQNVIANGGSKLNTNANAISSNTGNGYTEPSYLTSASALIAVIALPATDTEIDSETGLTVVTGVSETELPGGLLLRVETRTVVDLVAGIATTTTITTLLDANGNILSQTTTVTDVPVDSDNIVYDVDKDTDLIVPGTDGDGNHSYKNEKDTVVIPVEPDNTEDDNATATDKNTEGNDTGDNNAENTPAGTDRNDSYKNEKDTEVTPVKPGSTTGSGDDPYKNEDDTTPVVTSLQNENEIENNTANKAKTVTNPSKTKSITDNNGEDAEGKPTAVTSPAQNSDKNTETTPVVNSTPQPKASPLSNNNDVVNDAVTTTVTPTDTTDTASTEKDFSGYEIVIVTETPPPVVGAPTLPTSSEETPSAGYCEAPTAMEQSYVPYSVLTILCKSNHTELSKNVGRCEAPTVPWQSCVPIVLSLRGAECDAAISHLRAYSKSQETEQQTEISRLGVNSMSLQRNRTYPPRGQAIVSTEQLTTTKGGAAK